MKTRTTVIKHPSQLNALSAFKIFRTRGLGHLSLAAFEHKEKEKLEKELNKYYYACGCDTSAKALILFLVAGIVYSALSLFMNDMSVLHASYYTIGAGIGGGVVGKMIGIFQANNKLKRTVYTIQAYWKPEGAPSMRPISCG
jgi:hypothetical protein